ncbi:unnamed protein product [Arabis nemorensis]|uniref:TF-B3 domain-containing protein n=1 Tax=Arabis nemorensis TaxID=586526 RepID=A0A565BD52_9BRAS|nr:unnamed protein product [Arabis nemorensis]
MSKEKNYLRCGDSTPLSQNRFVTLTLTHDSLEKSSQCLPLAFMRENGMDKPGMITLLGKDGTKWLVNRREGTKQMSLGKGWRKFAIANGLKTGESFTLETIWENGTPMLSLFNTDSTSITRQQGENCSKASEKEHVSTKPNSGNKNSREEMRESSSAIQNRFVTLTLTLEDVRDCKLILPSQFMKANGINKLGKIALLGKNRTKWVAYLLSKEGTVALGCGWKVFCEGNGVKTGESFTLEFIHEQDATPVFEFRPSSRD